MNAAPLGSRRRRRQIESEIENLQQTNLRQKQTNKPGRTPPHRDTQILRMADTDTFTPTTAIKSSCVWKLSARVEFN